MEMMKQVYLIADPSLKEELLIKKVSAAIGGGVHLVQLWNNWPLGTVNEELIKKVHEICTIGKAKLILNADLSWAEYPFIDGLHLDEPTDLSQLQRRKDFVIGLTVNNDRTIIDWAAGNKVNYLSFCSMFPSGTSNSCELVQFETVQYATETYQLPVYLAGGIKHETLGKLHSLKFDGIALVSAIMDAENPENEVKKYLNYMNK